MIHRGRIRAADRLERLRDAGPSGYRVRHSAPALDVYGKGMDPATEECVVTVMASDRKNASRVAAAAVNAGRDVLEVTQVTATLEEVFIRLTTSREGAA